MHHARIYQLSARKLTQDATLEELQELEQLLREHPELASQLEMHGRFFNIEATQEAADAETGEAWKRQEALMRTRFPEVFGNRRGHTKKSALLKKIGWSIAAACMILALTLGYFFNSRKGAVINPAPPTAAAAIEATSSKHEVTLPDGSRAILNKNSHLYLSEGFGSVNRNIRLEGEAFFDVVHNGQLPFTVQAATVQVKVLGTAFNVRAYKDEREVETSLIRGAVEITDKVNKELKILMKPNEKVTIQLDEKNLPDISREVRMLYKMEELKKEEVSGMISETAWVQDKLVFNSAPLLEVVRKLEKWYNVSIRIENDALKEERFTGVFEKETINEALTALQLTYPFYFEIAPGGNLVIIK